MIRISLTNQDIVKCKQFAEACVKLKNKPRYRTTEELIDNYTNGKLAEVAVQKFIKNYGVSVDLDFDVYVGGDEADIIYSCKNRGCHRTWWIDVKTTSTDNEYSLLPIKSIWKRSSSNKLPHFYFFSNIEKNGNGIVVTLIGYISIRKLLDIRNSDIGVVFAQCANRKDFLKVDLRKLDNDWNKLFGYMDDNESPVLKEYDVRNALMKKIASY